MALVSTTGVTKGKGVGATPTARAGYDDYNRARDIAKNVMPSILNQYTPTNNDNRSRGTSAPAPVEYNVDSNYETILGQIQNRLKEQEEQAKQAYKTMYEQWLAQNKQSFESNQNQINKNYMRGSRYLNSMYGDAGNGIGLSNRARNYQNWQTNLASNRLNRANNDSSAKQQYNMNLSNAYGTLAQGWYNYILPIYTNRQQQLDDYAYRRFLATL